MFIRVIQINSFELQNSGKIRVIARSPYEIRGDAAIPCFNAVKAGIASSLFHTPRNDTSRFVNLDRYGRYK